MKVNDLARLNRSTRNAFFGSLILLGAVFIYGRTIEPYTAYLFAMHRYDTALDRILSKHDGIEDSLKTNRQKLDELTTEFAQVRNVLHTQSQAEEFFSDLQAISVETECPIYSLTFIADEPSPEVKQVEQGMGITAKKAVLSVTGIYGNIMRLIERLQMRNRKVWVEKLNMELINNDAAQVKCDIIIKIYTIQNKEAARYE
jgi:hypothetical protein